MCVLKKEPCEKAWNKLTIVIKKNTLPSLGRRRKYDKTWRGAFPSALVHSIRHVFNLDATLSPRVFVNISPPAGVIRAARENNSRRPKPPHLGNANVNYLCEFLLYNGPLGSHHSLSLSLSLSRYNASIPIRIAQIIFLHHQFFGIIKFLYHQFFIIKFWRSSIFWQTCFFHER